MSRSGYSDCIEQWDMIRWRGAVKSALRGKRGQSFLREMLAALDALPDKKLIAHELVETDGAVCALGALGKARGLDMTNIDPDDHETVASKFDVAHALACEIMWENDEGAFQTEETPAARFQRVHRWIEANITALTATQRE